MKETLGEYAARTKRPYTRVWFAQNPAIAAEVTDGFAAGLPVTVIYRWLRKEHDFPHGEMNLRRYLNETNDE
jgi:hypothetical protein